MESISPSSLVFESDNLMPDSTNPIKLYFAIVEAKAYLGDYFKNPYQ